MKDDDEDNELMFFRKKKNLFTLETLWRSFENSLDGFNFVSIFVCACGESNYNRIVSVGGVRSEDRSVEWT